MGGFQNEAKKMDRFKTADRKECDGVKEMPDDLSVGYTKEQAVIDLTSRILHQHYCENDVESIIALFDEKLIWFGTGEEEYEVDAVTVAAIFRQFVGLIPRCQISDEQYHAMEITPEVYLCTGKVWITTLPSANMYLRVHQRVTFVFHWVQEKPYCCHIHISNPYSEMTEHDVGFPTQMGKQSYEYLQECIAEQKKQIEEQAAMLESLSFKDGLTGLFNRNKLNQMMEYYKEHRLAQLGVACFDLNGLKQINDQLGHTAGDRLISRTACCLKQQFDGTAYRIGGDEFVIADENAEEVQFYAAVSAVQKSMAEEGISISVGISWRAIQCDFEEQFNEADRLMYWEKKQYYDAQEHDRRRR